MIKESECCENRHKNRKKRHSLRILTKSKAKIKY